MRYSHDRSNDYYGNIRGICFVVELSITVYCEYGASKVAWRRWRFILKLVVQLYKYKYCNKSGAQRLSKVQKPNGVQEAHNKFKTISSLHFWWIYSIYCNGLPYLNFWWSIVILQHLREYRICIPFTILRVCRFWARILLLMYRIHFICHSISVGNN